MGIMTEHDGDGAQARERGFFGRGTNAVRHDDADAHEHAQDILPDAYAGPEVTLGAVEEPVARQPREVRTPIDVTPANPKPVPRPAAQPASTSPQGPKASAVAHTAVVEVLPPVTRPIQAGPAETRHSESAGTPRPRRMELRPLKALDGGKTEPSAKLPPTIEPVRDGVYQGLLGDLLRAGAIDQAHADTVVQESTRLQRSEADVLLKKGIAPRAEVYASMQRLKMPISIRSAAELPEWDTVLNDVGGVLGGRQRNAEIVVLAVGADITRGMPRCFIVCTETARATPEFSKLTARRINSSFEERAVIITDAHVLGVIYSQWEARGGASITQARHYDSNAHELFDKIALDAYRMGASDIHMTCTRGATVVKVRVHGELERYPIEMTQDQGRALAESMYNTMPEAGSTRGGFDPRATQDAVIDRTYPDGRLRFRYSGLPLAPDGFDITLRIIPIGVQSRPKAMRELGYSEDQCEMLERFFAKSSGLILFCGTTGSGKSTTLANSLRLLAREHPTKKIRTVEEPVEYIIEGAEQTPVTRPPESGSDEGGKKKKGEDVFLVVLRQIMRADPDILMVGEIRDHATAELALSGVRSGHLLASTIHADGAPIVYDRMAGMGVSRLDMASVNLVSGLVYQRLVPVLCDRCKIPVKKSLNTADPSLKSLFVRLRKLQGTVHGLTEENMFDNLYLRNPAGCDACKHRGITGQTVSAEILRPTPNMLDAIAKGDSRELWRLWRRTINAESPDDMTGRTAMEHAIWKMRKGIVSPRSVEHAFQPLDQPPFEDN